MPGRPCPVIVRQPIRLAALLDTGCHLSQGGEPELRRVQPCPHPGAEQRLGVQGPYAIGGRADSSALAPFLGAGKAAAAAFMIAASVSVVPAAVAMSLAPSSSISG